MLGLRIRYIVLYCYIYFFFLTMYYGENGLVWMAEGCSCGRIDEPSPILGTQLLQIETAQTMPSVTI